MIESPFIIVHSCLPDRAVFLLFLIIIKIKGQCPLNRNSFALSGFITHFLQSFINWSIYANIQICAIFLWISHYQTSYELQYSIAEFTTEYYCFQSFTTAGIKTLYLKHPFCSSLSTSRLNHEIFTRLINVKTIVISTVSIISILSSLDFHEIIARLAKNPYVFIFSNFFGHMIHKIFLRRTSYGPGTVFRSYRHPICCTEAD